MLPAAPESMEVAKARYPEAIREVYDFTDDPNAVMGDPGSKRKHIFDFEDGLRLIVTRERMPALHRGRVCVVMLVHVSASLNPDSTLVKSLDIVSPTAASAAFKSLCERRFQELSGSDAPMTFIGWSSKGVPHWVVRVGDGRVS